HFAALGEGLAEQALAWWAPDGRLAPRAELEGLAHLEAALAAGRGALLVNPHFTTVEITGRLLMLPPALRRRVHFSYRRHKSPAVEALQRRARLRHAASLVAHDDLRAVVRLLRRGEAVWYAPDQNYRGKQSAFVPFFGVPAATITATSRLARLTGAAVLPVVTYRLPGGRWRLVVEPPLAGFPGPDPAADAARLNAVFERQIRAAPEQYLWVHRRFKTRPPGEEDVYGRPA
ncbi:MAG: lipid A biosynthesis acyltransferase, partial [Gammaproteobacteria bacterium]